jgi:glycosyltransferase involved in cell wall biosynthesis
MKIALVTDTYFPRVNGVSTSMRTFAREFAKMGHEVHIHAPAFPGHAEDPEPFRVVRYPSWYLFFDPEDRLGHADKAQIRAFLDEKYDMVHTQTPFTLGKPAVKWARRSGARVVHTYHTLFTAYVEHYLWFLPKAFGVWYAKYVSRTYCDSCDLTVTPSGEMRRELASYGTRCPIEVIPTGIPLERFEGADPAKFRRDHGFTEKDRLLLFVGRVAEEKNIDFQMRVFKRLMEKVPDLHFVIGGAGPSLEKLKAYAGEIGIAERTHFLGYISGTLWRDCYAAADLFFFASLTETQGLVVTEAMAAGTPVVAIARMGIRDVMAEQKGGLTVEPDEEEFYQASLRMLTDGELYARKKAETLTEAARWSSGAMAKKMLEAYEGLLKK